MLVPYISIFDWHKLWHMIIPFLLSLKGCIPRYTGTVIPHPDGSTTYTLPCLPCPQATYKEQIGLSQQCINCPTGTTTTGTAHISAADCGKWGTRNTSANDCLKWDTEHTMVSLAWSTYLLMIVVSEAQGSHLLITGLGKVQFSQARYRTYIY